MIELADWHWIFWINVPIGLVLAPLAYRKLDESYGAKVPLDLPGLGLASTGLFGLVFGLVRAQTIGWTSAEVMISLGAGIVLLAAFVRQELRTESPMLPMEFFAKRSFAVTNVVSMAMYFGMFGSIFFLSQFMQNVLGNTPLQAGLKLLVWTGATMVVAPLAGIFSEKFGARWFMVAGVSLQAIALGWLATEVSTTMSYGSMIIPFILAGSGMALVFAPSASAILNSVRVDQAGQASGATNAIRELGGTFGIAVLATVFSGAGAYTTPQAFVDGLVPALWVGVGVLTFGALVAALLPFGGKATVAEAEEYEELEERRPRPPGLPAPPRGELGSVRGGRHQNRASQARPGGRAPGRADRGRGPPLRPRRAAGDEGLGDRRRRRRRPALRLLPLPDQARPLPRRRRPLLREGRDAVRGSRRGLRRRTARRNPKKTS